ncbi:lipase family protein [Shewanella baltica]|uniref:lipase family protein n=1 Tax=Shewanella baltica TaxID=62322 RepID=UPI00217D33AF|nr:lipase family protein [Shewanella baltica]MCS6177988.1 lipase family protein [Shewanella baltica]MCS6254134.1 lipase family protein [Shewanella baltica]
MNELTPLMAASLADSVYLLKKDGMETAFLKGLRTQVTKNFDFDLSNHRITGISGSIVSRLFNRKTGFAVIGQGKALYAGDHVVAIRGTDGLRDIITDLHIGLTGGDNNSLVHAGFNKVFQSMKPALEQSLTPILAANGRGTVHCVGHSLGGALAHITADWVKRRYKNRVCLYTFGSPRVGLDGFAIKTTGSIDNIFRCTHASDPIPLIPLWPFMHAPYKGSEILLNSAQGLRASGHSMGRNGTPGYLNTANSGSWDALQSQSTELFKEINLKYPERHQVTFTTYWAHRINNALITLLKNAGMLPLIYAQARIGTYLTFYDMLASSVEKIAKLSSEFAEQTRGLLGHMLVFAGKGATKVADLSYRFIRWVFEVTIGALHRIARQALDLVS